MPKDSLDGRSKDLQDKPNFTKIYAAVIEQLTKEWKKKLRPLIPAAEPPPDPKSDVSTTQTLGANNSFNSGPFGTPFGMPVDVNEGYLDVQFEMGLLCRGWRNGEVYF